MQNDKTVRHNFIKNIIDQDLAQNSAKKVVTRFPPEPNGYLHIGHAKSICLNFGLALEYRGECFLRFDDTNPEKESQEYIDSIMTDVKWLGFDWGANLRKASDYFEQIYLFAVKLIEKELAYVCELSSDQIRQYRGTLTEPGKDSPYRNRTVTENLALFEKMKNGEFEEGHCVLRAKIDMASPNINLRDPAIYRIKKADHHSTGNTWCIYPMYDYAHCICDSLEGTTYSLCTLEFEDHRPLYDWFLEKLETKNRPQQIEFSRLDLSYTVMSKRKLLYLVENQHVLGWNDPRMPTISGMRRRGYTPAALRLFAERVGISKSDSLTDLSLLEDCVREDLNSNAPRVMAVEKPLKLIIENYGEGEEYIDAKNFPQGEDSSTRKAHFCSELYIEQDDFEENPPKNYFRLCVGQEVRLKYAYLVTCTGFDKNEKGEVIAVRCRYDKDSRGGNAADGRKVKGTIHWVSAKKSTPLEVHQYDRLFKVATPLKSEAGDDFLLNINPDSLVKKQFVGEQYLSEVKGGDIFQFERLGYFFVDPEYYKENKIIFNKTVGLKNSWG